MKIKNAIQKRFFTLVEVIVSMAVFAILMLGLMQFFASAQNLWTSTGNRNISYDEARTAMNMLATDLMCAYYEEGRSGVQDHRYFFIVQDPSVNSSSTGLSPKLENNRFKGLAFATLRSAKTHPDAAGRLTEVFYRKNGNLLEMRTIADNQTSASSGPWVTNVQPSAFTAFTATPFAFLSDGGYEINASAVKQTPETPTDNWSLLASNVVRFYVKVYPPNENVVLKSPDSDSPIASILNVGLKRTPNFPSTSILPFSAAKTGATIANANNTANNPFFIYFLLL